eukprot:c10514_g1_i1.p1 GENE.c10514_g1_i1~~c10514_g1_i1.p1  ORF type:complete len:174 (-),score=36.76 c10514_g1_i1:110-631(-)
MAFRGAVRLGRTLNVKVAEGDILASLKTKFHLSEAEISKNESLISACCKAYTRPVPGPSSSGLSEEDMAKMVPKLEAFYRPNQVLARAKPYVKPQDRISFTEFAAKELFSDHFKYYLVGWGCSLFLVTYIGLHVSDDIANKSAFIQSIQKRKGELTADDKKRLEGGHGHGDHH